MSFRDSLLRIFKKHKQLLPLLCLAFFCARILIAFARGTINFEGQTYDFELTASHQGALVAVVICFIVYLTVRHFYKYVLGITIILGLVSLINFSIIESSIGFSINSFKVMLGAPCVLVLVIIIIINFERIGLMFTGSHEEASERIMKYNQARQEEEINKFYNLYSGYPSEELREILDDHRFTSSAKDAVRKILMERDGIS